MSGLCDYRVTEAGAPFVSLMEKITFKKEMPPFILAGHITLKSVLEIENQRNSVTLRRKAVHGKMKRSVC